MFYDSQIVMTAAISERLAKLTGIRVAVPVMPLPGEALPDLIFRAACLNYFPVVTPLLPPGRSKATHYNCAISHFDLDLIADILGTASGGVDLEHLAYDKLPKKGVNFFGSYLGAQMFIASRRVAPRSLLKVMASKAVWHLKSLTFDPISHERLLDKCPQCQTSIDFRHSYGINRCYKCGPSVDFREFPQAIEEFDDPEAVRFFTGLVDPERQQGKLAVRNLHQTLASENPGEIFSLCVILAELIAGDSLRRKREQTNLPPVHLATAARAVMSWPEGVLRLVEKIEKGVLPEARTGLSGGRLEIACKGKRLSNSLIAAVNDLFKTYRFHVATYHKNDQERPLPPHLRRAVGTHPLEIARRSNNFRKAKVATGLSHLTMFGCFLSGYFGPIEEISNLRKHGFDEWIAGLKFNEIPVVEQADAMPLTNFVKAAFRGKGDPWPVVVNSIRERKLPIFRLPGPNTLISDLLIADLKVWQTYLQKLQPIHDVDDLVIRGGDCAFFFNATDKTLSRSFDWPVGTTFKQIREFDSRFVIMQELVDRMRLRGENMSIQKVRYCLNKEGISSERRLWRNRSLAEQYFGL
ncbi:hypothetical protein HFO61_03795 [Rhizobium leguminosarum]|uniref:hypothetical protein n=1 Tax=Rhizobium leguminosarum TaxID=384 RepID=UPI001C974F0A|nr:hypothetical protein [Rhizobium leguminosarum]MBY5545972.1 hypothetical protein [Rhizobium leguminosarum]